MASLSRVELIGNAGHDASLRMTPAGQSVAEFSLAVNIGKRDDPNPHTDWYRVSCWGKLADVAQQYVVKGGQVYVSGRLSFRSYQAKDGTTKQSVEVSADTLTLLGSPKREETGHGEQAGQATAPVGGPTFDPDEIPF